MELFGFVISIETVEVFKHLLLAALLGSFLGIERVFAHKMAGVRTYALVSMGAALFIVISTSITPLYVDVTNFDPLRMAASVIVGIGFIGAGYMGYGMALNLLNNCDLTVFAHKNRKPIDDLVQKGAKEATDLEELASLSNVIIMCVTNTPIALGVINNITPYLTKKNYNY